MTKHGSFINIDAYFSGIIGVKNGLDAINNNPLAHTFRSTLTDLFGGVPIISRCFNVDIDSVPVMYLNHIRRTDMICPLLVQSIAHFSYLGAPLLSMAMTWLALEFNRRMINTNNYYKIFVYVEMIFYISLFMELNTLIILGCVWIRLIYLFMLRYDKKIKVLICFDEKRS